MVVTFEFLFHECQCVANEFIRLKEIQCSGKNHCCYSQQHMFHFPLCFGAVFSYEFSRNEAHTHSPHHKGWTLALAKLQTCTGAKELLSA